MTVSLMCVSCTTVQAVMSAHDINERYQTTKFLRLLWCVFKYTEPICSSLSLAPPNSCGRWPSSLSAHVGKFRMHLLRCLKVPNDHTVLHCLTVPLIMILAKAFLRLRHVPRSLAWYLSCFNQSAASVLQSAFRKMDSFVVYS